MEFVEDFLLRFFAHVGKNFRLNFALGAFGR